MMGVGANRGTSHGVPAMSRFITSASGVVCR